MLYDPKRFNRETVWRWYDERKDRLFPAASADEQKVLKTHFDTLYERGWVDPPRPRDDQLVAQVRTLIGQDSLPKRTYDRLRRQSVSDLRDFTVAEKGGPRAMLVFVRASREPLTSGVPALYTKDGYYKHFRQTGRSDRTPARRGGGVGPRKWHERDRSSGVEPRSG